MKRKFHFFAALVLFCALSAFGAFAQDADSAEENSEYQKRCDQIAYGLDSEIEELLATLIKEEDFEYSENLYAAFEETRTTSLRNKIVDYFTAAKDKRLEPYALQVLDDPSDEKRTTVEKLFAYVAELKLESAAEPLRAMVAEESEEYLKLAVRTLGKCGKAEDSDLLLDLIEKDIDPEVKYEAIIALGELSAPQSFDAVLEIAQDSGESTSARMAAVEALGKIPSEAGVEELVKLYDDTDSNFRASVVKALACVKGNETAQKLLVDAIKDNHYKVRLAAIEGVKEQKLLAAEKSLLHRAKNDNETVVKEKAYEALSVLGTSAAVDYLISVAGDKKKGDNLRSKAAAALLKYSFDSSVQPLVEIARAALYDDQQKKVRYALGKEFAKYESILLMDICSEYLLSSDASTQGTGLDIYAKNNYGSLRAQVQAISEDKTAGANQRKAQYVLEKLDRAAGFYN